MCISEFFPASEDPPPPKPRAIDMIRDFSQTSEKLHETKARGRQVREVPTLRRENATLGERRSPTSTHKRKRTISDRELRDLWGDGARTKQLLDGSKKRIRKPPQRFGQDN